MARTDFQHDDVIRKNTGWALEPEYWLERQARREVVKKQSEHLADLLEAEGVEARKVSEVTAIGLVTGCERELDAWRSIRFIPEVAARDRRPMLNAFKKYLATDAGRYVRYGVVTSGDLVPAFGGLKEAMSDMKRRVSKLASWAKKEYDVEFLFRGVEYTRKRGDAEVVDSETGEILSPLCERNPDLYKSDLYYYNLHCNIAYRPHRLLSKEEWSAFLSRFRVRLGSHWKDNGKLTKPEELVKYIFKGNDLRDVEAKEAAWLQSETFNQRDMQPLGSFKDYVASLRSEGQKVVSVRGRLSVVQKATRLNHRREGKREGQSVGTPRNLILGVTMPQWEWTPWAEPAVLVQHYEPAAVGKAAQEFYEDMQALRWEARMDWEKSGAPAPETALAIAQAWKDEASAATVKPFQRRTYSEDRAEGPSCYNVHTDRLSVHASDASDPLHTLPQTLHDHDNGNVSESYRQSEASKTSPSVHQKFAAG